ncbi:helix-turn-helix domain-containing protein [Bradyrhizobium sp. CCGUVB14]|uniref:helix-turn-helix domain-containing protein n=1 Tax=Bradyrhizobium sp. CCGUVB14 TaxID=2949628 RepID=UPI0020B2804F|nr:helix-turn-helix domain-containing protein [Bradyrhizobium sp. CCGUVB14]MCP3447335.1 helix-turn-helix domain-containing protein [Bradyrhizobium sp. CCGUVB14]
MAEIDPLNVIIGANMRRLRLARGMTLEEIGSALGKTYQQVQKYERGISGVSAADLARCAVALTCTINEFFEML